jgi:hypothetical protein
MAVPTAPTATSIVTEALTRKLNGAPPISADITRASSYGLEKVKRDIMRISRQWDPLRKEYYTIVTEGKSRYSLPGDCETILSITLLDYTHEDAFSAITSKSSLTLDAAEDLVEDDAEGHLLIIYGGTGENQGAQIAHYSPTTKVVTLTNDLISTPATAASYLIADDYKLLNAHPSIRAEWISQRFEKMKPSNYIVGPYSNTDDTQYFELVEVPDKTYGLKIVYHADLRRLDTATNLYDTILRRWADIFEQGVYTWALGEDDNRYEREFQVYTKFLQDLKARDGYMMDQISIVRRIIQ